MINMTDRYTISAPVAVNADLFAKLHSTHASSSSGRTSEEDRPSTDLDDAPSVPGSPVRSFRHHHTAGTNYSSDQSAHHLRLSSRYHTVDASLRPLSDGSLSNLYKTLQVTETPACAPSPAAAQGR